MQNHADLDPDLQHCWKVRNCVTLYNTELPFDEREDRQRISL